MAQMQNCSIEVELFFAWVNDSWGIPSANARGDSLYVGLIPFQLGTLYVIHKANKWAGIIMF